jgi:L-aspartate oxidase
LLEGLVFGIAAADHIAPEGLAPAPNHAALTEAFESVSDRPTGAALMLTDTEIAERRQHIQQTMSRDVGLIRSSNGLMTAIGEIAGLLAQLLESATTTPRAAESEPSYHHRRAALELLNMTYAAAAISASALRREESRGAHFRSDYPAPDPKLEGQHDLLFGGLSGTWTTGPLSEALQPAVAH